MKKKWPCIHEPHDWISIKQQGNNQLIIKCREETTADKPAKVVISMETLREILAEGERLMANQLLGIKNEK